jgi:hypothetical protein
MPLRQNTRQDPKEKTGRLGPAHNTALTPLGPALGDTPSKKPLDSEAL